PIGSPGPLLPRSRSLSVGVPVTRPDTCTRVEKRRDRGNYRRHGDDYRYMTCGEARGGLSGLLDGEASGVGGQAAREPLSGCPACQHGRAAVRQVSSLVRVRSAAPVPGLTEQVLAAVAADPCASRDSPRRRYARRRRWSLALRIV